jgi:hypothetical protein
VREFGLTGRAAPVARNACLHMYIPAEVWRAMAISTAATEVSGGDSGPGGARHFDAPAGGPKAGGRRCRHSSAEVGARKQPRADSLSGGARKHNDSDKQRITAGQRSCDKCSAFI